MTASRGNSRLTAALAATEWISTTQSDEHAAILGGLHSAHDDGIDLGGMGSNMDFHMAAMPAACGSTSLAPFRQLAFHQRRLFRPCG